MTDEPRKPRRWPRRALIAIGVFLALVLLVLFGAIAYLNTPSGAARLRAIVVKQLNDGIAGRVEIGALSLHGTHFRVEGIRIVDPDGKLVAEIVALEGNFDVGALITKTVVISHARIESPRFYLASDERGLNLSRAFHKAEPSPPSKSVLSIAVTGLSLDNGYIEFGHDAETFQYQRADAIHIDGSFELNPVIGELHAKANLAGHVTAPINGPLTIRANADRRGDHWDFGAVLDGPGAALTAKATLDKERGWQISADRLALSDRAVRAFIPSYPLQVEAGVRGTFQAHDHRMHAALELRTGSANATLNGGFDSAALRAEDMRLSLRGLDLHELLGNPVRTDLSGDLTIDGGGRTLDSLDGHVSLAMPASKIERQTFGPVELEVTARHGDIDVRKLRAAVPGLRIHASGTRHGDRLAFHGGIDGIDLAATARTIGNLSGDKPPALRGHGELSFAVTGSLKAPTLGLNGTLPQLTVGTTSVEGLSLSLNVPNAFAPYEATAAMHANRVRSGKRALRNLDANVETQGRDLDIDFSSSGFADVTLHVRGTVDEDRRGANIREIVLKYPGTEWTLAGSTRIESKNEVLTVSPLELRAGSQRVKLVATRAETLNASLDIEQLGLAYLPEALIPPEWRVGGTLDVHVRAHGRSELPDVDASLTLDRGRFRDMAPLRLKLSGRYAAGRIKARFDGAFGPAPIDGSVNVPVTGLIARRAEPMQVSLNLHESKIEDLLPLFHVGAPVSGKTWLQLNVTGTAREPLLRLAVSGRNVRYKHEPPLVLDRPNFDFVLESNDKAKLGAKLSLEAIGTTGEVSIDSPYSVRGLLDHVPGSKELQAASFDTTLTLNRIDLRLFHLLHLTPDFRGHLSLRVETHGSFLAPTAAGELKLDELMGDGIPTTDVALTMVATRERVDGSFTAKRAGHALADVTAGVGAPLEDIFRRRNEMGHWPLTAHALIGPVALAEMRMSRPHPDRPRAFTTDAALTAELDASGTLANPRATLRATLDAIRVGNTCVASAIVRASYVDGVSEAKIAIATQNDGRLNADAKLRLPLSLEAPPSADDLKNAQLDARARAERFDLSALSGLVPQIRLLAGRLDANLSASGTVNAPRLAGRAEWKEGRLAVQGYGEQKEIHLAAQATQDRIELSDLTAHSGAGWVTLKAKAERSGRAFELSGSLTADRFPIVYDDQPFAAVQLRSTFEGELSDVIDIRRFAIAEAHVDLPDVQRKDLQSLDRPEDIVIIRDGKRMDRRPKAAANAPVAESDSSESSSRQVRILIEAPRNLWVRGGDVNAEIGLSDGFRVEYAKALDLFGDVRFFRGRIEALGRKFDVERESTVRFTGPAKLPYISVTADHVNEREQVTVFVTARGQGKNLQLKVSSQPPLAESEIYTLLATGRRQLKRGSSASMNASDAASVVGSYAASELKRSLAAKVPIDVLSVEAGEEGVSAAKVEAGKYITDQVYFGSAIRIGATPTKENAFEGRLEYQFSPHWSVEGSYGDARVGGADIFWSRDF